MPNRLDQLQKAEAEIGQAIERMTRAIDAIRFIEPDKADILRDHVCLIGDVETDLNLLQDLEPVIR